jgi:hypothetical protein
MTVDQDPDATFASWLDEGPTELPSEVRRAILVALPTTRQSRRDLLAPWRFTRMNVFGRIPAMAIAILVAVSGGAFLLGRQVGGPGGPEPSATPTPTFTQEASAGPAATPPSTADWTAFTSPRLGIRFKVPPGWTMTPATVPWIWRQQDPGPPDGASDTAVGPSQEALVASSERLPEGMSESEWWADYTSGTPGGPAFCFPTTRDGYRILTHDVGGAFAYVHGGVAGCNFTEAIVLVGGRAYQLTAYANIHAATNGVFDEGTFEAWLATVSFDPASANDTP